MLDNATYNAFLSHSHQDAEIVEALGERLEDDAGLRVWLDKWELALREQECQECHLASSCNVHVPSSSRAAAKRAASG